MEKTNLIRAVSRSIAVLKSINRQGSMTMMELARAVDLPYPTVSRIVQTLMIEGMLECEPTRKRYRATERVRSLSSSYREDGGLIDVARPYLVELTKAFGWPAVLSSRVGSNIILRDSTHSMTSLVLNNYHPGYTMPILECSPGQMILAHMADEERLAVLHSLEGVQRKSENFKKFKDGDMPLRIRAEGYVQNERNPHTNSPGKTSSFSVPVFTNGRIAATLSIVFFSSAMTSEEAVARYLPQFQIAAADLSIELSARGIDEHQSPETEADDEVMST